MTGMEAPTVHHSAARGDPLRELEERLGHVFRNRQLLVTAMTHSSFANEATPPCADNEALEFLGDAVLTFDVADRLYGLFPHLDEGRLSRHKHLLTCRATLADVALELGLANHLRLGRGETRMSAPNARILANLFEAVVAAIHLDAGLEAARSFIERALASRMAALDPDNPVIDWKSAFQERTEKHGLGTPTYRLIEASGPDHARTFRVAACVGGRDVAEGTGPSKRSAHQAAARLALQEIEALAQQESSDPGEEPGGP
jgi:ribonuclease-3